MKLLTYGPFQCQKFQLKSTVVFLRPAESSTGIAYNPFLSCLGLIQNCSQSRLTGINMYLKRHLVIRVAKYRRSRNPLLQILQSFLFCISWLPLSLAGWFLWGRHQIKKGFGYFWEVLHKLTVISCKTKKLTDLFRSRRCWPWPYLLYFVGIGFYTIFWDNMSYVLDFLLKQWTLLWW